MLVTRNANTQEVVNKGDKVTTFREVRQARSFLTAASITTLWPA